MKTRLFVSLTCFVIFAMLTMPVAAQEPEPAADATEMVAKGEALPLGDADLSVKEADKTPESVDLNTIYVYYWTNIRRDSLAAKSEGWSSASSPIYYMKTSNYLCRNGSCTSWYSYQGYNLRWTWAGWTLQGGYAEWYTRSMHYFLHGGSSLTYYTFKRVRF